MPKLLTVLLSYSLTSKSNPFPSAIPHQMPCIWRDLRLAALCPLLNAPRLSSKFRYFGADQSSLWILHSKYSGGLRLMILILQGFLNTGLGYYSITISSFQIMNFCGNGL